MRADEAACSSSLAAGSEADRHAPVAPGEVALWGRGRAARRPARALRPRTPAELVFLCWGRRPKRSCGPRPRRGTLRLEGELATIVALADAWGADAHRAPSARPASAASEPRICAPSSRPGGVPTPADGGPLDLGLPGVGAPVERLRAGGSSA